VLTENTVQNIQQQSCQRYAAQILDQFTPHHQLLHQTITELDEENEDSNTIQTGEIHQRYQELADSYEQEPLSNRRISDYLKHLELLNLIEATYHYGGKNGKTREIRIQTIRLQLSKKPRDSGGLSRHLSEGMRKPSLCPTAPHLGLCVGSLHCFPLSFLKSTPRNSASSSATHHRRCSTD
jgi:hypothetical protein